jgi:hypothetical protein
MNFWKWLTGNPLFALAVLVGGIVITVLFITITQIELVKIANKLLNVGVVFLVFMVYKLLFHKPAFPTDEKIADNSIAVALDSGSFIIAIALAVTL